MNPNTWDIIFFHINNNLTWKIMSHFDFHLTHIDVSYQISDVFVWSVQVQIVVFVLICCDQSSDFKVKSV